MIAIVVTLILIGLLLYLVERFIPMDPTIMRIIQIVVVIAVVLWLLQIFGVLHLIDVPPPHV